MTPSHVHHQNQAVLISFSSCSLSASPNDLLWPGADGINRGGGDADFTSGRPGAAVLPVRPARPALATRVRESALVREADAPTPTGRRAGAIGRSPEFTHSIRQMSEVYQYPTRWLKWRLQ